MSDQHQQRLKAISLKNMNSSTERLTNSANGNPPRWSASTTASTPTTPDLEKESWHAPPVPPIPTKHEELAWRRRYSKRSTYTSQMSATSLVTLPQPTGTTSGTGKSRPGSAHSTYSTSRSSTARRDVRQRFKPEHDAHAELHWEINALNPRNWSARKKWQHISVASAMTFTVTLASSITALTRQDLRRPTSATSYQVSGILQTSLFVLALACGPLISRPCSALLGRKVVYLIFAPIFALFTLIAGLVNTSAGVIVCRMLAGLSAAPVLSIGCALITDIFGTQDERLPLAFYYTMPILGPVIGMVLGGPITQQLDGNFTQYITIFGLLICLVPVVLMHETSRDTILRRQNNEAARQSRDLQAVSITFAEPFITLCTSPTALLCSLYCGFHFAVLYASFVAFPEVFSYAYVFDLSSQGLVFFAMGVGIVLGFAIIALNNSFVYKPRLQRWEEEQAAEAEKGFAPKRPGSRGSHISNKSVFSMKVNPKSERPVSRSSIALSLRSRRQSRADNGLSQAEYEKNARLAAAAADYLNSLPANKGRRIMPERVHLVLNRTATFGEICSQLEAYEVRLDPVQLAKVLVDAEPAQDAMPEMAADSDESALARSKSLHRNATEAALGGPTSTSENVRSRRPSMISQGSFVKPKAKPPPAAWRLWLALPGSLLVSVGLFVFAWTAHKQNSWVAPCFGMGMFACGLLLVFTSMQLYILARYGPKQGSSAVAGDTVIRYVLSFAFTMFALNMYRKLGTAWATSTFAIISLIFGALPWFLVFFGSRRKA